MKIFPGLARAALFQNAPVYVQFYITARCNLTCKQCNIIYANSDVRECTLDEIKRMADNFQRMGVAVTVQPLLVPPPPVLPPPLLPPPPPPPPPPSLTLMLELPLLW